MISREETIKKLELKRTVAKSILDSLPPMTRENSALNDDIEMLTMAIEALQDRPKGRWIDAYPEIEKNPMFMYGICSNCGCKQSISNKLNFCFDCGADMKGE